MGNVDTYTSIALSSLLIMGQLPYDVIPTPDTNNITSAVFEDSGLKLKATFNFNPSIYSLNTKEEGQISIIQDFANNIIENSVDLSEDQARVINDNFWDLI